MFAPTASAAISAGARRAIIGGRRLPLANTSNAQFSASGGPNGAEICNSSEGNEGDNRRAASFSSGSGSGRDGVCAGSATRRGIPRGSTSMQQPLLGSGNFGGYGVSNFIAVGHSFPLKLSGCSRQFSSTDASLLGDVSFDPFTTHYNSKDADRADQMVRDLVKSRLAGGGGIGIKQGFLSGALNSYRVLSERAAERARRERKRRPDASFAKRADQLLVFAEQACAKDPFLSPDIKSYAMVVDAYAKIGEPEHAEAVLLRLEKLWRSGNEKVEPNTTLYSSVLHAWAKSGRREAPKRAEAILQHMEQLNQERHAVCPNAISYSSVINAWAKSREKGAAKRADDILNHMIKLQEAGREECRPNTLCFNSVIDAWARSRDAEAPKRAEALLEKMDELYRQGNEDVCPNTVSYNAVINTWAKSREKGAAQRAEGILDHMLTLHEARGEECRPDSTSFTAVIDAWAKSNDKDAHAHAQKLFQQMQSIENAVKPNSITYNSLINTLAVSSVPDKATKAFDILLEMENMANKGNRDVAPTIITYGAVMKACARTSGNREAKRRALQVALEAFDKLRRSSQRSNASPLMYDPLFITIAISSKGSEYAKLATQVFKFCCEDGALNNYILKNLRRNSPRKVFENLVGRRANVGRNVSVADLPTEWSRNSKSQQ